MTFKWRILWGALLLGLLSGCPNKPGEALVAGADLAPLVYDYGGIRVVQVLTPRAPVEMRLVFRGGKDWEAGAAPVRTELGLATLLRGGSSKSSPATFLAESDALKASFRFGQGPGYAWLGFQCLPEKLGSTWSLFQEILLDPAFPEEVYQAEVQEWQQRQERLQQQSRVGLAELVRSKGFGPFPFRPSHGQNVAAPGLREVSDWYRDELLGQGKLALVVTGPLDPEAVGDLLFQGLSGNFENQWEVEADILGPLPRHDIFVGQAPENQEAIALYLPLLSPKTGLPSRSAIDQAALQTAAYLVEAQLEQGFAKDPSSREQLRLSFQTVAPMGMWLMVDRGRVMPQAELLMADLRKLYQEGIDEAEIAQARQLRLNDLLQFHQSNRSLARILTIEMGAGDPSRIPALIDAVQSVSAKTVNQQFRQAMENLSWFYFGVPSRLDRNALSRLE